MEVIPEFSGVGQGLDDTVHETGVAQVDQSCKTRQAHFLLLLFFMALVAGRGCMGHRLHHAGRFRLRQERFGQRFYNFSSIVIFTSVFQLLEYTAILLFKHHVFNS